MKWARSMRSSILLGLPSDLSCWSIEKCFCSRLNVGGGVVTTQHGNLPVPAPATAELLRGAPTYSNGILRELTTPTGAAIISTLASGFGAQPPMSVDAIGYGAGATELAEQPNVLRILIGESAATQEKGAFEEGTIVVLEANIDDMNPQLYEQYGYVIAYWLRLHLLPRSMPPAP